MTTLKFFPILLVSTVLFADGRSGVKLTGRIETLPANGVIGNWIVGGRTVQVTRQTSIDTNSGPATVGACVDIKGDAVNATTIAATDIDTRPSSKCGANSTPAGSVEIFGSVDQLPASGLRGDWRVGGTTVHVTAQTRLDQDGGPVTLGACAEVKGTRLADNSINAAEIEISSGMGGCRASNGAGNQEPLVFRGTVQSAPGAGSEIWMISGRRVLIGTGVTMMPGGRRLSTGDCVEVQGRFQADNSITASRVQILGSGVCTNGLERQAAVSFDGTVTALPSGSLIGNWNVSALVVTVTSDTRIDTEDARVAVGVCVTVKGDFAANNTVRASRIETRQGGTCQPIYRFDGAIQRLPGSGLVGQWTIGGRNVVADANTVLDVSKGGAMLGACAAVTGLLQADTSVRASRIEILSASGSCITSGGVVGGGNLSGTGVAPGEIITIFGMQLGPATAQPLMVVNGQVSNRIANTQVLFDGTPATLLFVSESQINAVVPCNVAGKTSVRVQVESNGAWTNVVTLPVFATYPSLFTQLGTGVGGGAILNLNYTLNTPSNPTTRGAIAILYGTGQGQTNPACTDGTITTLIGPFPVPLAPVSLEVGGKAAAVIYAGSAPGLVNGVVQVNFVLAPDTPVGPAIPVVLKIGDRTSQPGVSMAVQ